MTILLGVIAQLVEETLLMVRTSSELGRGSCSTVDECMTDSELRTEILTYITQGKNNAQEIFDAMLEMENIRESVARDIRGWGGEE